MQPRTKQIISILGILLFLFSLYYFSAIFAYMLIAAIISLIGAPVVKFLRNLKIKNIGMPDWLCALITLGGFIILALGVFSMFAPLVASEAEAISKIDVRQIEGGFQQTEEWLSQYNLSGDERSNREFMISKLKEQIQFSRINQALSNVFNLFGLLSNALVLIFSVLFISFFFLKDGDLLLRIIYSLTPDKYMNQVQNILRNALKLLTRYFVGLLIQITAVTLLLSAGLWIIGIENAFLIGFLGGLINLIPYIGPLIGATIGLLITASTNMTALVPVELKPILLKVGLVFLLVQLLDNLVLQPVIFSKSANAHPLEIFIVISIAGTIAGITGMILAIPAYSFVRIVAREFFFEFKAVNRLTRNLE